MANRTFCPSPNIPSLHNRLQSPQHSIPKTSTHGSISTLPASPITALLNMLSKFNYFLFH